MYIGGIRCTRNVCVNGFGFVSTAIFELRSNELDRLVVIISPFVILEGSGEGHTFDFFGEEVTLVEEQNDACLFEPSRVRYLIKERQSLSHTISGLVLEASLIVLTDGSHEQHGSNTLEAVNPFFALVSLTADIKHLKIIAINRKIIFDNASGSDTSP